MTPDVNSTREAVDAWHVRRVADLRQTVSGVARTLQCSPATAYRLLARYYPEFKPAHVKPRPAEVKPAVPTTEEPKPKNTGPLVQRARPDAEVTCKVGEVWFTKLGENAFIVRDVDWASREVHIQSRGGGWIHRKPFKTFASEYHQRLETMGEGWSWPFRP